MLFRLIAAVIASATLIPAAEADIIAVIGTGDVGAADAYSE